MKLHDDLISVFRCQHCLVMFAMTRTDKETLRPDRLDILVASPCPVCGKQEVDYLGEVGTLEPSAAPLK